MYCLLGLTYTFGLQFPSAVLPEVQVAQMCWHPAPVLMSCWEEPRSGIRAGLLTQEAAVAHNRELSFHVVQSKAKPFQPRDCEIRIRHHIRVSPLARQSKD